MQRPLEKFGWHKRIIIDNTELYYKGKDWLNSSILETASEIKREKEKT